MRLNWSISKSGLIIGAQAVTMLRFMDTLGVDIYVSLEMSVRRIACVCNVLSPYRGINY